MRKTILTLSAATLAITGASLANAQRGDRPNPDANGDGVATFAEVQAHGDQLFARLDVNGDGVINSEDRQANRAERFAEADTNGDGELSQAEMKAMHEARKERRSDRREARAEKREGRMAEHFARADTDNSGGLSQDELRAMHEARGERHEGKRGGKRAMRGGHGKGAAHMMLRKADKNRDKTVTRAEFDAELAAHFTRVDADGNGAISAEERKTAHQAMRAERKAKRQAQ